ncbi:MAG: dihydroorotate dehydrogenase-like protein [Oscillochloris sp.]|nr:dihydroorotate dehydrogenase-like protein [Oscillochloris sp.]
MINLNTSYMGLPLNSPLVLSASPLSQRVETVQRLAEAGISAVVMYSLFEEQIIQTSLELDHLLSHGSESFAEALSYLPDHGQYSIGPDRYLEQVRTLKRSLDIPVIGSLNGVSSGGWVHYAREIELAGADALELNIYFVPTDPNLTSAGLEQIYVDLVRSVRAKIKIPLAVKLSPYFTALPNLATQLEQAGANALVLFNRFYQPDFDLENLEVVPNLHLSDSHELRLPLRWIALLYGRLQLDFALSSGVHRAQDILKAMMAGANVAMTASALLKNEPVNTVQNLMSEMRTWMQEHEYESIVQMRGSMSQRAVAEPAALERANYMKVLSSYRPNNGVEAHSLLTGDLLYPFMATPDEPDR